MQHFDNGHLPEPTEHFFDKVAGVSACVIWVSIEATTLAAIAFGTLRLGDWIF